MRADQLSASVIRCMRKADRDALGLGNDGMGNPGIGNPGIPVVAPCIAIVKVARKQMGPTKTEAEFRTRYLGGTGARFEALVFRLANGHRYTPDWVVVTAGGRVECHEVKGGYSLHSHQRARLAFDQARIEFPWIVWVWAVKAKNGWRA